jgi:2-polyprenyl-3-methyl-5-hydroxy-6-metoxy-1,4-benzoquinol methylase
MAFEGRVEGFPEHGRPRDQLIDRARGLEWYHTLRLDRALTTQGLFSLDEFVPFYLLPESLEGLDCLDVGTGNGYWAFSMEQRKARSVAATDIADYFETDFSAIDGRPPLCPAPSPEGAYGEPFRLAATLLGSRVRYVLSSAYDLSREGVGSFDLVFCGSVLMHLHSPMLALRRIASVCRNALLLTTQTDLELDGGPLLRYRGHEIPYVHFVPSPTCLVRMVEACGYEKVLRGPTFHLRFRDRERNPDELVHTTVLALKSSEASCLPLPQPRLYTGEERECGIEVVSAPDRVAPGDAFDLVVRVENRSRVPWRADGRGVELTVGGDTAFSRGGSSRAGALSWRRSSVRRAGSFADYLPPGVSTLVRLRFVAPADEGSVEITPAVFQGSTRFSGCERSVRVTVAGDRAQRPASWAAATDAGDALPAGLRPTSMGLLRRADALLQTTLGRRGSWYTRARDRLKRAIRGRPRA